MTTIRTYSGKTFDFSAPDPASICLTDIAHALSHVPRFCGHTPTAYSVAQHCVLAAEMVEPGPLRAAALMHDATEAYMQDIPSPLKALLPDYRGIEERVWQVIAGVFGVDLALEAQVKHLDRIMLATEMKALFGGSSVPSGLPTARAATAIVPVWTAIHARVRFVREADALARAGWLRVSA